MSSPAFPSSPAPPASPLPTVSPVVNTTVSLKTDASIISLIGFAHGTSHFFHLMLPPLFPWFMRDFGLSFVQVGMLMTTFFVISGVGQAFAGIVVDRFGALRVLYAGVSLLACSALLVAVSPNFAALFGAAAVAGLGNSVFHPADFTLINRRVSLSRLGHAFSVHGLSGNLGWAASPVLMLALAAAYGWRVAALGAALVGAIALAFLVWKRGLLKYELQHEMAKSAVDKNNENQTPSTTRLTSTWHFLSVRVVWMAFAFFFFSTMAFGALQNFAPPLLRELYSVSLALATSALTAYLLGASAGLVCGGFAVKSGGSGGGSGGGNGGGNGEGIEPKFEYLIAAALAVSACLAFLLASAVLPSILILPIMALMGFGVGLSGPSRDMLVRRATAARLGEGAFGRVYGLVYSGLDAGLAVSPIVFGLLLDAHLPRYVFVGVGCAFVFAILTALAVGKET